MKHYEYIPVSCNRDCISGCPLEAVVEGGILVGIRNNPHGSEYMNGCARGFLFPRVVYHPDRILHPLIRKGERGSGDFRRASWDEALDLVAARLAEAKRRYGPSAVMRIGGSGACRGALHHTSAIPKRFFSLFGGYTDTDGSFSSQASDFVKPHMYGTKYVGIDVKSLFSSKLILLWGFNAVDTRFGPETEKVLDAVKGKGVPIVVIDPRRTRTVKRYADQWLQIYPGTDSALMLAVLHVLLTRDMVDRDFLEPRSVGFDELEAYVLGRDGSQEKSPEWASRICGLPAERIEAFAVLYGSMHPAALLPGLSIQRTIGGEDADRLAGVLQLATGNVGIPGGSAGTGQWNNVPPPVCGRLPVPENPTRSAVAVYQWADAVLDGPARYLLENHSPAQPMAGEQAQAPVDIQFLYNVGGNYLVQGGDVNKSRRAFLKVGFTVTHDYFLTDTARYSDVVLPVSTFVERSDIIFSNTNYLYYSGKAVEPPSEVLDDWEIFRRLAARLGFEDEFTEGRSPDQWLRYFLEESEVDDWEEFMRTGLHRGKNPQMVGLSDFVRDPEGHPLMTESGRIEVSCPSFERVGGSRIPRFPPQEQEDDGTEGKYPLYLITPHERMRNNSQFDNVEEFRRSIDNTVWIHPLDAAPRGIGDGEPVVLFNGNGSAHTDARVTEDTMRGVLVYHQGRWEEKNSSSSKSVNLVSSSTPTFPSRGARTHSIKVDICREEEYSSHAG
jgi:anaerobic dimethyl sulfoxide reductase subunit A